MKVNISYTKEGLQNSKSSAIILFLSKEQCSDFKEVQGLEDSVNQSILSVCQSKNFEGNKGQSQQLFCAGNAVSQVLLVGLGKEEDLTLEVLRRAAGKVGKTLESLKVESAAVSADSLPQSLDSDSVGSVLTEGILLGEYSYDNYKSSDEENPKQETISLTLHDSQKRSSQSAVDTGILRSAATNRARNLGNTPPNDLTPTLFELQVRAVAEEQGLKLTVLEEADMEKLGMSMLLGVSKGSVEPAKLMILEYSHEDAEQNLAIVGKGITFDSGGISLKPGKAMDEMKFDMCGAAAVLGTMSAVSQLKPKLNITGVIGASENLPGGNAQRPGDIVKAYNGKTVEILNTDAEGRLLLGDALSYTVDKYKPDYLVDLATLTGACVMALGHYAMGAVTNNDEWLQKVLAASNTSGDRAWELPAFPEYEDSIKGKYADLQNIGDGSGAGTITAGLFLKNFVGETPWVHLDIAGSAWGVKNIDYQPQHGATGTGVRLLLDLISGWEASGE